MKHAYLILAHDNFEILEKLIKMLDDKRNDIYIHIDKRIKDFDFEYYNHIPNKSQIFFTDRIKVQWGGYSLIKAELILMKTASLGYYDYYHLISGVDLPLKTQDYIHSFIDKNYGYEFINVAANNLSNDTIDRLKYYYIFSGKKFLPKLANKIIITIEKTLRINRLKHMNLQIKKGANWISITHGFIDYILSQENSIKKIFNYTCCADEIFVQTILWNSEFKDRIYTGNKDVANMRLIDWNRGTPYTWQTSDYNELLNSNCLFARKFNYNKDSDIVNIIYNTVCKSSLEIMA